LLLLLLLLLLPLLLLATASLPKLIYRQDFLCSRAVVDQSTS